MRRLVRLFLLLLVLGPCLTAGAGYLFWKQWHGRGPLAVDATVIIVPGSRVTTIARQLEDAGVVEDYRLFTLGVRLFADGRPLRAGEYRFGAGMSQEQVMRMILSGATVARRITVPEGFTTAQALRLVSAAEGLVGDLPPDLPGEGRLLPETYFYTWGETRFTMVNRMAEGMQQGLDKLWAERAPDLPYDTPDKALVLASIVEKETAQATERAHIAGVFVNRMRRGMMLQSDPTVIYALTNGDGPLGRPLTSADMQVKSPFNTYMFKGLPPSPICDPGLAAIEAVLHPQATKDLYFVADGSGGHAFAQTLAEHYKNVAAWHRFEAQQASAAQGQIADPTLAPLPAGQTPASQAGVADPAAGAAVTLTAKPSVSSATGASTSP
ncbi:MAG TPA: endolytic transglycosylase MltG [Candidatus Udaeobacter sp.]|nr:endolytic transglycosylase MltG [Candidatus Udaeobacter sp.]